MWFCSLFGKKLFHIFKILSQQKQNKLIDPFFFFSQQQSYQVSFFFFLNPRKAQIYHNLSLFIIIFLKILRLWCGRWTGSGHFRHKRRYVKRGKSWRLEASQFRDDYTDIPRLLSPQRQDWILWKETSWLMRCLSLAAFFADFFCGIKLTPSLLCNSFVTVAKSKFNNRGWVQVAQDNPLLYGGWLR